MSCGGIGEPPCQSSNTIPWSDPAYWTGWNETFGTLGGSIGSWVNAFDGNSQQQMYYQQPPQQNNNNIAIYIGMGLLFLMMLVIVFILFRKK